MTISDSALINTVRDILLQDSRTAGQTIDVIASEGVIVLFGACDEDDQAHVAVTLTEGLVGVKQVLDRITRRNVRVRKVASA